MADMNEEPGPSSAGGADASEDVQREPQESEGSESGESGAGADSGLVVSLEPEQDGPEEPVEPADEPEEPAGEPEQPAEPAEEPAVPAEPAEPAAKPETHATLW